MSSNVRTRLHPLEVQAKNRVSLPFQKEMWMTDMNTFVIAHKGKFITLEEADFCFFSKAAGGKYVRVLMPDKAIREYELTDMPFDTMVDITDYGFEAEDNEYARQSAEDAEPEVTQEVSQRDEKAKEPIKAPDGDLTNIEEDAIILGNKGWIAPAIEVPAASRKAGPNEDNDSWRVRTWGHYSTSAHFVKSKEGHVLEVYTFSAHGMPVGEISLRPTPRSELEDFLLTTEPGGGTHVTPHRHRHKRSK